MNYELNYKHLGILLGFMLVVTIFSFAFIYDTGETSLTGYVVFEGGTKIKTDKLDSALVNDINLGHENSKVIVILEDDSQTTSDNFDEKKQAIENVQEEVIEDLKDEIEVLEPEDKVEIITSAGIISNEEFEEELLEDQLLNVENIIEEETETDFELSHRFDSINAFSGEVKDPEALLELTKNKKVKKIILDYPVEINLDNSVSQINVNPVWDITFDGKNITGEGETVCVIDTGIDYTHSALGSCNPVSYQLEGNVETLLSPLESNHPYENSFDYTWTITQLGFENIALHFVNLSLEQLPNSGDSTDRVYIYDQNNRTLAIYKESMENFWTPHAEGDTIYVRLVSDGSVTDYGFLIDQTINGTTNSTMDWSSCRKVIGGWDAYNNDNNPRDDHGHGTHVAGIVASENETYQGVAPGASLVAIKAISASGAGYSSDVVAGIDWCNTNAEKLNISVISMSLGCSGYNCPRYQNYCNDDLTANAIMGSYQKDISVFIATGNGGWTDGIANPACVEHAFPVGAVTENDNLVYNRGDLLKLLAPGTNIDSATLSNSWFSLSGTSMATPHLAGAAVLLKQYWKVAYGINAAPQQIFDKLFSTGKRISDPGSGLTFSRIDLSAAIKPVLTFDNETSSSGEVINFSIGEINDVIDNQVPIFSIDSDLPLTNVTLELKFENDSVVNHSLMKKNSTHFYYAFSDFIKFGTGNYSYKIYGEDALGSVGFTETRNLTFNLVSLPDDLEIINLSLNIISPLNNSYHRDNFYLNFTVNGTHLNFIDYQLIDSSENVLFFSHFPLEIDDSGNKERLVNLENNTLENGNYTLLVYVNNSFGDALIKKRNIVVDTLEPNLVNISYSPTTVYINSTLNFTVNIFDLNLDSTATLFTSNYSGTWNNYSLNYGEDNESSFSYGLFLENSTTSQTFYYQIYVSDLAGNEKYSDLLSLNILNFNNSDLNDSNLSVDSNLTNESLNTSIINETISLVNNSIDNSSQNINNSSLTSSCSDNVQNGNEIGVDCGGSCQECTSLEIVSSGGSGGGGSGGGSGSTTLPVIPKVNPTAEKVLTAEKNLPVIADTADVSNINLNNEEGVNKESTNLTSELELKKISKKEKAFYVLGFLILILLAFYAFFLWFHGHKS